jgi:hypothetical protein
MPDYRGWIGVDLDGTLAYYDEWRGIEHIGKPVPIMVSRVQTWLKEGKDVRIFTARVANEDTRDAVVAVIEGWCLAVLGRKLPVTHQKDFAMVELWDDRVVQVIPNTGLRTDRGVE